jgi:hypothetical protein
MTSSSACTTPFPVLPGAFGRIFTSLSEALPHAVERRNLGGQHPNRLIVALAFPARGPACRFRSDWRCAGGFGGNHFHTALPSSSVKTAMRSPFRVFRGRHAAAIPPMLVSGSMRLRAAGAPGVLPAAVHGRVRQLTRGARTKFPEGAGVGVHRVTAPIEPERSFSKLSCSVSDHGAASQGRNACHGPRFVARFVARAGQLGLTFVAIALSRARHARGVDRCEQARPELRRRQPCWTVPSASESIAPALMRPRAPAC